MAKISLPDFFKYFDPNNANQLEAVVLLESMMPDSLLQDATQQLGSKISREAGGAPIGGAEAVPGHHCRI